MSTSLDPNRASAIRSALRQEVLASPPKARVSIVRMALLLGIGVIVGAGSAVWAVAQRSVESPSPSATGVNFPAYYDDLYPIDQSLSVIFAKYPNVGPQERFDPSTTTVLVGYWANADPGEINGFTAAVARVSAVPPLKIVVYGTRVNATHLADLARQIGTDADGKWSSYFGAKIVGANPDYVSGTVVVGVDHMPTNSPTTTPDGTPVTIGTETFEWQ